MVAVGAVEEELSAGEGGGGMTVAETSLDGWRWRKELNAVCETD